MGDPLAGAIPEPAAAPLPVAPESTDLGGAAEAATFGTLQGLTGNLFGYIKGLEQQAQTRQVGPESAELAKLEHEEQAKRMEAHPFARGAGEFAGMLLSPLGKVGELAKLTKATTVAGRIGSEMLGQGAVGALYGAGQTLSDASLGDHEITADKLIAGTGLGALLGAGGGLLGAGITEATKAVLPSLVKSLEGAQGGLEDFANDRWIKATQDVGRSIDKVDPAERPAVAQVLREHFQPPGSVLPEGDTARVLESVRRESEQLGGDVLAQADFGAKLAPGMSREDAIDALARHATEQRGIIAKEAEKAAQAQLGVKNLGGLSDAMDRETAQGAIGDALKERRSVIVNELEQELRNRLGITGLGNLAHDMGQEEALAALQPAINAEGERIGEILKSLDKSGERASHADVFNRFEKFLDGLDADPAARDIITPDVRQVQKWVLELGQAPVGSEKAGWAALNRLKGRIQSNTNFNADGPARFGLKKQLAGILKDEIDKQIEARFASSLGSEWQKAKASYGLLSRAEEALGRKSSTGADAIEQLIKEAAPSSAPFAQARSAEGVLSEAAAALKPKSATGAEAVDALTHRLGVATPEAKAATRQLGLIEAAREPVRLKGSSAARTAGGADAMVAAAKAAGLNTPQAARLSALRHAGALLEHGIDRTLHNRSVSLTDYLTGLTGGAMAGGPLGILTGVATSLGHKVLRERGSALAARLADQIAASPALSTIAQGFAQRLPQIVPQLGPYGAALSLAASESPRRALAEHMVMAQTDPAYRQAAQVAGLVPEDSQQHGAAMVRAHGLAQVAGAVLEHDKLLDRAVDSAIKGGKAAPSSTAAHDTQDFGTKRMRRDAIGSHDKRVDEVRQLAANPDALVERLGANLGNLHNVAPGLAAVLTQRANAAVQFLSNEARTPPKAGPLAPAWSATEHERWVFARKLQAVEDPMSVLRHASAGTMTGADVAAFRAVYPALHTELTRRIVERVTQKPESVSYGQRVMLSLFTGLDLDGTMNPAAVQANQQAIARQSVKPSNQAPKPTSEEGGALTLAQRTATPSQRHEMQEGV